MTELRSTAIVILIVALVLSAALVSAHERHYAKRRLILLQARVEALERAFVEDRTL